MNRFVAVVAFAALSHGLGACSSVPDAEDEDDAQVAATVCGALRSYVNELVDVANDAVDGIGADEPEGRVGRVVAGFAEALSVVERQRPGFANLDLPAIPERDTLVDELLVGLDEAIAELNDEQERFVENAATLAAGPAQGIAGTWFNSIEKVMSVSEPEIFRYDRVAFKQAFLDEPDCRHVIQQFEISDSS